MANFNAPTKYIIPKVHKSITNPPGHPIITDIGGPLERVGKYLDNLIKETVTELPSYVQDMRDVLTRLDGVEVREGAILVSIDVESLYTFIPHHQGIAAVAHFLTTKYPSMASQH